jgi:hypothetical protein
MGQNNNLMLNLMDKMNCIIKQNEEFKEEIKILKEQITTKTTII